MNVTKLKNGYRIRCNAGEFEALQTICSVGTENIGILKEKDLPFFGVSTRAWNTPRFQQLHGALATIDEDRSASED